MAKPKKAYGIRTVSNAFRLLEAFQDAEELGVTELSVRLELHKNNVFRLLATLDEEGYIEQDPDTGRYRLGARCLELARAFMRGASLRRRARPVLEELAQKFQETVHLGALVDFEVAHLDGEQPDRLVMTGLRVGRRLPAHCTALGKVVLGCAAESVRKAYDREVASPGQLERRTPNTIVDPHKLFEHLRTVAGQGYALDLEECEPGLCCVAVPVYDASGGPAAALSISGPSFRMGEPDLLERPLPALTAAAERLSRALGGAN